MCKLCIKHIGSINDVDVNIARFTMVIGPESSGKSTIAKLLCHCEWVEKRCFTNQDEIQKIESEFLSNLQNYHRMEGYIDSNSYLKYVGNYVTITLEHENVRIEINNDVVEKYLYPKICFIPSERNFAATIPNLNKYNESNDNIMYFLYDWDTARKYIKNVDLKGVLSHDISYRYDNDSKEDLVYDGQNSLKLRDASSGVQSVIPLYTTVEYLLERIFNRIHPLTLEQRTMAESFMKVVEELKRSLETIKSKEEMEQEQEKTKINMLLKKMSNDPAADIVLSDTDAFTENFSRKFFYACTNLFIEEPEQNIFPRSQERIVYWLLSKVLNGDRMHTAFVTTHSPFMLFALNNCLMGNLVKDRISSEDKEHLLSKIAWSAKESIAVYELHNGQLKCIQDHDGLLMDNYLNKAYKHISSEYLEMLAYYDN